MEGKNTQKTMILEHLKRFGSIEPLTALREYGCLRLAARIADLKAEGYNINTEKQVGISSITGRPVTFAKYVITDESCK